MRARDTQKKLLRVGDLLEESGEQRGGYLLGHVLRFGRLLRLMGVDVSLSQMLLLVEALNTISITNRTDFYYTARATLVDRHEDFLVFDQAFSLFWNQEPEDEQPDSSEAQAARRARLPSLEQAQPALGTEFGGAAGDQQGSVEAEADTEALARQALLYSPQEVLRRRDFGEMSWEEVQEAKRAIASMDWKLGWRRTRRYHPASKGRLHLRGVIRHNLPYGGEPLKLTYRQRVSHPRSLAVLCDISGSMERYSRMLLHFIHALSHGLHGVNVEAFVFGTRLTHITRCLRYKDVDEALDDIGRVAEDYAGGTRIGSAIKSFNYLWARRVLSHGAVAIVISDGWDRGDNDLLIQQVAWLQRSTYRLIWLNPWLGSQNYEPIQRGMANILPFIDNFLPVNNLVSLQQLADLLSTVGETRPDRKQHVRLPDRQEQSLSQKLSAASQVSQWNRTWAARVTYQRNGKIVDFK